MARRKAVPEEIHGVAEERPDNAAPGVQVDGQGLPDAADAGRYSVRLLKRHTHAGIDYQTGDIIHVSAPEARWLIDHGIGHAEADNHPTE